MAWFKVDDRLYSSLKVMRIPRRLRASAIGLWTMAGSWSAHDLTDGYVPDFMIEEFGADEEAAEALVTTGLWERVNDSERCGFVFVKWSEYQPTKADQEEKQAKERERKRRWRRNQNGEFAGEHSVPPGQERDTRNVPPDGDGLSQHGPTDPVPTRPVPSPIESGRRKRPARPLPPDWTPTETHQAKARDLGININVEVEKFRNWAESKDERKANWNAAFTNWLIRAGEQRPATPPPTDLWERKGPF
ncbi:hypothetical protein M3G00_07965 [Brevibacterium casei]|uniref:hypothetical protein n=1 Tax=Brevibacterium casei TaxID=33889 RepID=UPI00223C3698|nr:hypothetical protein [Brevibacterium casei]MCT2182871.1 hypothetical protein [Brevibacterium casei]